MQPLWRLTVWLGCIWIVSLLYVELLAFWIPRWRCSWPDLQQNSPTPADKPIRVALIADPQLTDRTSHGLAPGSLALKIIQFYSDIYMRRAFRSSVLGLEPDEIIILGDSFDGGPFLSHTEWEDSYKRFEHVFDQSQRGLKKLRLRMMIPMYFLCGNHDIGYHEVFSQKPQILHRYKNTFGETDYSHKVGGLEFVFVNAQALDGPTTDAATNFSWNFIERQSSSDLPKVLLTHIPLYKPDNTPCGPLRSSPVINQRLRRGNWPSSKITYQDYLTNETSYKLLSLLKPIMVFSGHDHDQCKVDHLTSSGVHTEYTIGTFSWQQGNIYPSFAMLSVSSRSSPKTDTLVANKVCFLPPQTYNYAWYGVLFVISMLALFLWPSQGVDIWPLVKNVYEAMKGSGSVKEKDEDAEYEMVWDAEGAMHLIKKSLPHSTSQQNQVSERRGTAVQRAVAKSKISTATEDVGEATNTTTRSRIYSFKRRINQIIGPFTVLLAVNLSLYMMLVMKDWT